MRSLSNFQDLTAGDLEDHPQRNRLRSWAVVTQSGVSDETLSLPLPGPFSSFAEVCKSLRPSDACFELRRFYQHHGVPKSKADVAFLVQQYEGRYDEMFCLLAAKYDASATWVEESSGLSAAKQSWLQSAGGAAELRRLHCFLQRVAPLRAFAAYSEALLGQTRGETELLAALWNALVEAYGPEDFEVTLQDSFVVVL